MLCASRLRPIHSLSRTMMRAIVVEEAGGADALCLKDVPRPSAGGTAPLGPEEVLVANAYAGVNFIDTYQRSGLYPIKMPAVLGREGAGVVTAVGEAVSEVRPGQKVAYLSPGAYAEETRVAAKHVAVLPESVSLEEGGAALLQGMTAAYLTHYSYRVSKGDCVLIPVSATTGMARASLIQPHCRRPLGGPAGSSARWRMH